MLVDTLPMVVDGEEESSLSSSFVEKDSMMLELVLREKMEKLGLLGKSVDDVLREEVLQPPNADGTPIQPTKDSLRAIAVRIIASITLLSIRQNLSQKYFLGIVGPQNSGKSTLTSLLLGSSARIRTGDDVHTEHAFLYTATPRLKVGHWHIRVPLSFLSSYYVLTLFHIFSFSPLFLRTGNCKALSFQ